MFLVVGGMRLDDEQDESASVKSWTDTSSTELLPRSSSVWVTVSSLPRKLFAMKGATLGGYLYMTG